MAGPDSEHSFFLDDHIPWQHTTLVFYLGVVTHGVAPPSVWEGGGFALSCPRHCADFSVYTHRKKNEKLEFERNQVYSEIGADALI